MIGECERTWNSYVEDFLAGDARAEYVEPEKVDLSLTPVPDYSSLPRSQISQFLSAVVQTSRGCPYDCEFCDCIVFSGRKVRYKPVDTVIAEIDQLHHYGFRNVFLGDDNFSVNRRKAMETLKARIFALRDSL